MKHTDSSGKPRNPLLENLEVTVREKMAAMEGTAHSYAHVDRVRKIAVFLAEKNRLGRNWFKKRLSYMILDGL
jgi:hypothetical protein